MRLLRSMVPAAASALLACGTGSSDDGSPAVRIERIATLDGSVDSQRLAAYPIAVVRLASGAFVVSAEPFGGTGDRLPRVYDAAGRYMRTIGRIGDGPGEFREPVAWAAMAGDSLLVADPAHGNGSLLDARDVTAATIPLPRGGRQVVMTSDGHLVANAPYNQVGERSALLVRVNRDGAVQASFGGDSAGCGRFCGIIGERRLAADAAGGVWSAHRGNQYLLEHFDRTGQRRTQFTIAAPWFTAVKSFPPARDDRFPYSMINGIGLDSAGRLWIVASTADAEWEQALGPPRPGEGGSLVRPVADIDRYRDGILEVRDTVTGALIASHRFTGSPIVLLVETGLLAQVRSDDDGWKAVDILRVSLAGQGGTP